MQNNAHLTLPPGFCATVFADNIGAPRHMVVAPNGDLLVIGNPYATNAEERRCAPSRSLALLRDENGDGKADLVRKLEPGSGSGIALANGFMYTSAGTAIVRYKYVTGDTMLGAADTVVSGLHHWRPCSLQLRRDRHDDLHERRVADETCQPPALSIAREKRRAWISAQSSTRGPVSEPSTPTSWGSIRRTACGLRRGCATRSRSP